MAKFLCGGSPQDYTMFANVEDGATSSQAYVKGEYIVRNKVMREVIAPIAQGDSFVIGTNLSSTGTNVGEELTELNSSLDNIDVRYTTANGAEWSPRGAGTWYPFSSHYVAYLKYAGNDNYIVTKLADDQLPYSVVTYRQQSMVTYFDGLFNVRYLGSVPIIFDCVTPGKLTAANGDSTYYIRILDASHDYYNPKAVIRAGESYDLQIGESFAWDYGLNWTYKY